MPRPPFAFGPIPPYARQRAVWEASRALPAAALFMDTGTGKTRVTLDTAVWLYCTGEIDALVVLAPNGVHRQWVEEGVPTHVSPTVPHAAAFYTSQQSKRARALVDAAAVYHGLRILAMNIEALAHQTGYNYLAGWIATAGRCMVVIDESQKIQSPSAATTTHAWRLRGHHKKYRGLAPGTGDFVRYRRILSATPTGNGLENLYAQFRYLDPDIIGCQTYTEFKALYCDIVGEYHTIVGYRNVKQLRGKLAPYVFKASKADLPDLPPETWARQYVTLSPEQAKAYKEVRRDYQTQLASGEWVTGELAITRLRVLQQIVAGHVTDPETRGLPPSERKVISLPCPRVDQCVEFVQTLPGKWVLWAEEQFEITRLYAALRDAGIRCVTYYGGIKPSQREENKHRFKTDPTVMGFVANPASGGAGLDLPVAADDVYYSHTWSWLLRRQAEGRIHRPGVGAVTTEGKVTHWDFIARGTIDERIRRRVSKKQEVAQLIADLDTELLAELVADEDFEPVGLVTANTLLDI